MIIANGTNESSDEPKKLPKSTLQLYENDTLNTMSKSFKISSLLEKGLQNQAVDEIKEEVDKGGIIIIFYILKNLHYYLLS